MKIYNKLVRDYIPEIIGARCDFRLLTDAEYLVALDEKLNEELAEYQASKDVAELADLLEVIYAAASARGVSADELDLIRNMKAAKRGCFYKKIMLLSVQEDDQ